ncbi:MAG TPA: hypothetical protein VG498_02405, partial [Terriglobales bacterium]|nr:hypothetical protein [Terriglobales bacterium]
PTRRRAVSDFDVTHNLVINYLYEIPSPRSGALWALKNWQWGGIFQTSSGLPFSPLVSGDALGLNSADVFDFADFIGGSGCGSNPTNPQNRFSYIKTQCFAFPNPGTRLGNAGRNSIRGPGLQEFDTSLIKSTHVPKISENFIVQFRAEMFNVANRVNYGTPLKASTFLFSQTGAPISSAGQLTQTSTSSRQVQFAIKLLF